MSQGIEPYLRDIEGTGKYGIHRYHPKKGVWSIFQGFHQVQVVRKQQVGSEKEFGLLWTEAEMG